MVTWNYKPRDSLIQRFDPRALVLFFLCAMLAIIMVWDVRIMLAWFVLALGAIGLARIRWSEMRRFWLFVLPLILLLTAITAFTGRDLGGAVGPEHFLVTYPIPLGPLGVWNFGLSVERLVFGVAQFARIFTLAALGLVLLYSINPAHYGATFRRLGFSDKFAYATELAFRLVPTVAADFQTTLDAQKARGYEVEEGGRLFGQVRNLAPLVVPVTINTILSGEEMIDAMDLRAFGTAPRRTWVVALHYATRDYVLILTGIILLLLTTLLVASGRGGFWMPAWLPDLLLG